MSFEEGFASDEEQGAIVVDYTREDEREAEEKSKVIVTDKHRHRNKRPMKSYFQQRKEEKRRRRTPPQGVAVKDRPAFINCPRCHKSYDCALVCSIAFSKSTMQVFIVYDDGNMDMRIIPDYTGPDTLQVYTCGNNRSDCQGKKFACVQETYRSGKQCRMTKNVPDFI